MPDKKLTGRIAAERVRMQSTPKPPAGAVERFLALGECTSLISDVMDELGVPEGVIGASVLKPTLPGKLIVGPALTVRNIRQRSDPLAAQTHVNRMAEFEAHNLAEFTMQPRGGATNISWVMHGPAPFLSKVMQVFIDCDRMIGKDFESGLANLKAVSEK